MQTRQTKNTFCINRIRITHPGFDLGDREPPWPDIDRWTGCGGRTGSSFRRINACCCGWKTCHLPAASSRPGEPFPCAATSARQPSASHQYARPCRHHFRCRCRHRSCAEGQPTLWRRQSELGRMGRSSKGRHRDPAASYPRSGPRIIRSNCCVLASSGREWPDAGAYHTVAGEPGQPSGPPEKDHRTGPLWAENRGQPRPVRQGN